MESLAAKLPGPREITHVFLDPGPKVIKLAELESLFESRVATSSMDQYSPLLSEESSYLMLVCRSLSKFIGLIASLLMALTCKNIEILKVSTALNPSKENYLKYEDLDYLVEHFTFLKSKDSSLVDLLRNFFADRTEVTRKE